jgi:proteasome lid subunit RPN8/RPN11
MDQHARRAPSGGRVSVRFKIMRSLLEDIRSDLARPHPFAHERVGFISASLSSMNDDLWVLARAYRPVADEDYLRDPSVGAMMGPEAIRKAHQWAMSECVAIFHVHTHGGSGQPDFSSIDLREHAKFMPSFFQIARKCPHGALVLSGDSAIGNIWLDPGKSCAPIAAFVEVGAPLKTWQIL